MDSVKQSCRLCLASSPAQKVSISDSSIRSKLDVVFQFELPLDDSLPDVVCHECSVKVDEFHSYHETVRTNQDQLKVLTTSDANMLLLVEVKGEPADDVEVEDPVENAAESQTQDDTDLKSDPDSAESVQSDLDEENTTVKQDGPSKKRKQSKESNSKIEQFFNGKIPCSFCSAVSETFVQLVAHSKEKHGKKARVTCCKRSFRKCYLIDHIDIHLDPKQFHCDLCKKCFTSMRSVEMHMEQVHANPKEHHYQCSECDKTFAKKSRLTAHSMRHNQVQCTVCNRMLATIYTLKAHMEAKHSEEGSRKNAPAHTCDRCGQSFTEKQTLQRHFNRQHLGIKDRERVQCKVCNKWVNNKSYLQIHTRNAHSGENLQVTCEICHKVYPNGKALWAHKHRTHKERNLACEICGKKFNRPKYLKEHRASHMGHHLYSCTVCNYTSNFNTNVYAHMKNKHPVEWAQAKATSGPLLTELERPKETEKD